MSTGKSSFNIHTLLLRISAYLLILLVGFIFLLVYTGYENSKDRELIINLSYDNPYDNEIFVETQSKEGWDNGAGYGNEYLFILSNNSNAYVKDWEFIISLDETPTLDSFWNANIELVDDKLYVTPIPENESVQPGASVNVGAVMHSKKYLDIRDINLTFKTVTRIEQTLTFKILLLLFIIGIIGIIIILIVNANIKRYERDHANYKTLVNQSLRTIANIIDTKDPYTRGHSVRVAIYSRQLAQKMGLSEFDQERIYYIGLLHDIGKIGIPTSILTKPGRLTNEEYEIIKRHPQMGGSIIRDFTSIKGAENGIKYHHERYDGKGYNEALAGEDIPLEGRIICVADAYDAMSSKRCYRDNLSYDYILDELKINSGTQFDPKIVPHMIELIEGGYAPVSEAEMKEYEI